MMPEKPKKKAKQVFEFRAWDRKAKLYIKQDNLCNPYNLPVTPTREGFKLETTFLLERWTGLKDKKGRKIFEGDILACSSNGEPDIDVWKEEDYPKSVTSMDDGGVHFRTTDGQTLCWDCEDSTDNLQYLRIIGNINENPDLL